MYSPEIHRLLATDSEQRRTDMKNAVLAREAQPVSSLRYYRKAKTVGSDDGEAKASTPIFFDEDALSHMAAEMRCGSGDDHGLSRVRVLNGLVRRGPREPAAAFTVMPARYM